MQPGFDEGKIVVQECRAAEFPHVGQQGIHDIFLTAAEIGEMGDAG